MSIFYDDFNAVVTIPADLTGNGWTSVVNDSDITLDVASPAEGAKSIKLDNLSRLEHLLGISLGPDSARLEFYFRFSSLPAASTVIARTYQGSATNLGLRLGSNGKLEIVNASNGSLGFGSATLTANTWHYIEWRAAHYDYVLDREVVVAVDGSLDINLGEGVDTRAIDVDTVDGFALHGGASSGRIFSYDRVDFIIDGISGADISSTSSSSSLISEQSTSSSSLGLSSSSSSSSLGFSSSSSSSLGFSSSSSSLGFSSSSSSSSQSSQSTSSQSSPSSPSSSSSSSTLTSSASSFSNSSSSSSSSQSSQSSTSLSSQSSPSSSSSSLGTSSSSSSLGTSSSSESSSSSQTMTSSSSSSISSLSSESSSSSGSSSSHSVTSSSSSSPSSSSSWSDGSESSSGQFAQNLYLCGESNELFLQAWRRRDGQYAIKLVAADGQDINIDASNVVVIKIGKDNSVPYLDIHSVTPTANGSWVSNTNPAVLNLDNEDLLFAAGIYDIEIVILNSSSGRIITSLEKGVFALHETQRGITAL